LLITKFIANLSLYNSTKVTPFKVTKRYNLKLGIKLLYLFNNILPTLVKLERDCANKFANYIKAI
ncbi:hypothetical protein DM02DRAFT_518834, partial [Periconia macrospinosa]